MVANRIDIPAGETTIELFTQPINLDTEPACANVATIVGEIKNARTHGFAPQKDCLRSSGPMGFAPNFRCN
jgi:hypothetical protein